jgi:hypothetical protein
MSTTSRSSGLLLSPLPAIQPANSWRLASVSVVRSDVPSMP